MDPSRLLTPDEHARARSITLPDRSQRWMASRAMLRQSLGELLGIEPLSLSFECNEFGKPSLSQKWIAEVGPFWFNYTHSGQYAALATSRSGEIGIDLEELRPIKRIEQKASLFLSDGEQQELFAEEETARQQTFLQMWVMKEALAKALGGRIAEPCGATCEFLACPIRG